MMYYLLYLLHYITRDNSFKVKSAPGRWGKYTKIVRFMPHVVVINNLNFNVKLVQPTGI